ncbi:TIM23 complex component [Claviceps lovelessii]|nr:TIM23 complex component [Claviceps lovelessii]
MSTTTTTTTSRSAACLARAPALPLRHSTNVNSIRTCSSIPFPSSKSIIRLVPAGRATPSPMSIATQARCLATSSTSRAASPTAAAAAASPKSNLDWDSFFKLRLRRRRIQLLFSVTTGVLGGAGGAIFLSTGMAEPLVMQIPLDPFVTLGLMTLACAGLGWLVGPSIGNQVFYLMNHRLKAQMMQKESEFFTRVKKHRVNPTNSSASNPVPDFYGEKIQSVSGYRQWLKDQRAFNKKKTRAFV